MAADPAAENNQRRVQNQAHVDDCCGKVLCSAVQNLCSVCVAVGGEIEYLRSLQPLHSVRSAIGISPPSMLDRFAPDRSLEHTQAVHSQGLAWQPRYLHVTDFA